MPIGQNSTMAVPLSQSCDASVETPPFSGLIERPCLTVSTTGNPAVIWCCEVATGSNYHVEAVQAAAAELGKAGLKRKLMVDCSHANSEKDFRRQSDVLASVAQQLKDGSEYLMGVMIESHLVEGNQKLSAELSELTYGQSITDACVNIETTALMLENLAQSVN